ncbi:hypothetical protein [Salipaludibacillus daqingensis]|uniref:hypothetical protein n=1 Tax=Salipaludibacillus daqingensis TaxID=3041001 RepID=UPI002475F8FA|nr:hypothetical protein [Salipaludibacillus daqingensis]
MGLFDIFKKKKNVKPEQKQRATNSHKQMRSSEQVASRKGELSSLYENGFYSKLMTHIK